MMINLMTLSMMRLMKIIMDMKVTVSVSVQFQFQFQLKMAS